MNRHILSLLGLLLLSSALWGQSSVYTSVSISTIPPGARFTVDNQTYTSQATFSWPIGSKHILRFITDPPQPGQAANTTFQTSPDGNTVFSFGGWVDNTGLLVAGGDPVQTITANPALTFIHGNISISYRVTLNFFNDQGNGAGPVCGAPGNSSPSLRPGVVYLGGACYWGSAVILAGANTTLTLNAFPYPGFAFLGWITSSGNPGAYLGSITITGPTSISPQFVRAKRVRFLTSPLGFQVNIDRTEVPTLLDPNAPGLCPNGQGGFPSPATGIQALCFGDFDFLPNTIHEIGAPSPQSQQHGKIWVFDSFSDDAGKSYAQNSSFLTNTDLDKATVVTANFIPGAYADISSQPPGLGLKLTVDGKQSSTNTFVWGVGTKHQVSAAATQFASTGRKYTFRNWSNGGPATQTVTIDPSAADLGFAMSAAFDIVPRVIVQTLPPGLTVQVDGQNCPAPCTVDRPLGSSVRVSTPASIPLGDDSRFDFASWSDGGKPDHTFTINSDFQNIWVSYTTSYRLTSSSDPAGAVNLHLDPPSPDGFYSANQAVTVTAEAKPGFKFRRWGGDLSGTFATGYLTISGPRNIIARLDRIPYIAPAGVRNAAGVTPDGTVAPGSIISIFGESLAPVLQLGRVNPLAQNIAGVSVTVGDRILPLFFVSPQQINAQLPSDLPEGDYTLVVHTEGQADITGSFTATRNAPGLLSRMVDDKAWAVALHEDGSVVTPDSPARNGEMVTVLGTGFGPYDRHVIDGFLPGNPPPVLSDFLSVAAGSLQPSAFWSGASPGYIGVAVTKFKISDDMVSGSTLELTVNVNGKTSNTVLLPIQ